MQASQIRDKYKQILEEPQSENSQDEWEIAYSQMAKQRKKRILTQASPNKSYAQNIDSQQSVMNLKQRLAQCLSNCKEQSKQIDRLKKQQMLFEEEKNEWQESSAQYQKTIEEEREIIKQNVQKISQLQQQIITLNSKIEELSIDRQLQFKQSEYYKQELSHLKEDFEKRQKQYKSHDKQLKQFDRIKKENQYLKNDVERLSSIIEDSLRFGKVSSQLMKKHFLGKPHKELDYWFPQHTVAQVQIFLKKHQIGYGNKDFTASLVKFIDKISQKSSKQSQMKIKNIHSTSKARETNTSVRKPSKIILENSTYKKHSYNLNSLREEALRSNTSSFWKAAQSRIFHDPHNQNCWQIAVKSYCWEIITEFKSIVFELLLQKEVKRKKIKKLIDSMCNGVMEAFEGNQTQTTIPNDRRDQSSTIKLEVDDITAPLKTIK